MLGQIAKQNYVVMSLCQLVKKNLFCVTAMDSKKSKQNGNQLAILDQLVKQNDMKMYHVLPCRVNFEKLQTRKIKIKCPPVSRLGSNHKTKLHSHVPV